MCLMRQASPQYITSPVEDFKDTINTSDKLIEA